MQLRPRSGLIWVARGLGFLASAFFLSFLIGEGGLSQFEPALLPTLVCMGVAIAGYVLAWWRPGAGGRLMMLGSTLQAGYLLLRGGLGDLDAAIIYWLPLFLPGLFFWRADQSRR